MAAAFCALVGLILLAPPAAAQGTPQDAAPPIHASFDCAHAHGAAEELICSDAELAQMDLDLDALYHRALRRASDPDAVRVEQKDWLALSRNACRTRACLMRSYAHRKHELLGWLAP